MTPATLEARKLAASAWFEDLQVKVIAALEKLEDEAPGPFAPDAQTPGRFVVKPWTRIDHSGAPGGGGRMAMLNGRVFEKVGVHISTVFGTFAPEFAGQIQGAEAD